MWQCRASYLVEHFFLRVYGIFLIFLSSGHSLQEILRLGFLERDPINETGSLAGIYVNTVFQN